MKPTAPEGAETLAQLVRQADDRIVIMPGSGVRSDNIAALARQTGAVEFHSSARKTAGSKMRYFNAAMNENLQTTELDTAEVEKMLAALQT